MSAEPVANRPRVRRHELEWAAEDAKRAVMAYYLYGPRATPLIRDHYRGLALAAIARYERLAAEVGA